VTLGAAASYDEMITRIAGGDEGAFAELYDRICSQVLGLVQRFRVEDEQAEELVYGIFLEIWRTAPLFDSTNTTAAAWILHLAHVHATAVIDGDGDGTVSFGDPGTCISAAVPPAQVPVVAGASHKTNVSHPEEWDSLVRNFLAH
jgi:pimeloyl-ACP methyl ester carboxylesterase